MNRVGKYVQRAFEAYDRREWDDLLLQLCPCIDFAAGHEYGQAGRTSFRRFVDDNFYLASSVGLGPRIDNFAVSIRVKGLFNQQAERELYKARIEEEAWILEENASKPLRDAHAEIEKQRQSRRHREEAEGVICVPFGHIVYHCLRCELLHKPGSAAQIEFVEERVIDNTDYNLKLPIGLLYGYILAAMTSPVFLEETHRLEQTMQWHGLVASTRLSWLWGRREKLVELIDANKALLK